jgi:16S rRNA G966 N2-methylase RsmD
MKLLERPTSPLQLTSDYWRGLSWRAQERWVDEALQYWRERGFPHFKLSRTQILTEFARLCRVDPAFVLRGRELRACTTGLRLANYFHPHMWRVPANRYRSPWQVFVDDEALRICIRNTLFYCRDRLPLGRNSLRRSLQTLTNTSSVWNFKPAVARALYQMFSHDGDVVLDFCAGFGGRLLAALSLRRHYLGIEPSRQTLRGLMRMERTLTRMGLVRGRATLWHGCAEDLLADLSRRSASLVFTSPPYFDRERYSSDGRQSFRRYPTYERWREEFLMAVIAESSRILVRKGKLVLNVADRGTYPIAQDAVAFASRELKQIETYKMRMPLRPYQRRSGNTYRHEPVFVFEKQN